MKTAAELETLGTIGIFEKTCAYCGAHLRLLVSQAPEANRSQHYLCPACGKAYKLKAVAPPEVRVLRGRTDGKDDRYQETMF